MIALGRTVIRIVPFLVVLVGPLLIAMDVVHTPSGVEDILTQMDDRLARHGLHVLELSPGLMVIWGGAILAVHSLSVIRLQFAIFQRDKSDDKYKRKDEELTDFRVESQQKQDVLQARASALLDQLVAAQSSLDDVTADLMRAQDQKNQLLVQTEDARKKWNLVDQYWQAVFRAIPLQIAVLQGNGEVLFTNNDQSLRNSINKKDARDVSGRVSYATDLFEDRRVHPDLIERISKVARDHKMQCWESISETIDTQFDDRILHDLRVTLFRLVSFQVGNKEDLLLLIADDITPLDNAAIRQAIEAREAAAAHVQELCRLGNVGLFKLDLRTRRFVDCNDAMAKHLEYANHVALLAANRSIADIVVDSADLVKFRNEARQSRKTTAILRVRDATGLPIEKWLQLSVTFNRRKRTATGAAIDVTRSELLRRLVSMRFDAEQDVRAHLSHYLHRFISNLNGIGMFLKAVRPPDGRLPKAMFALRQDGLLKSLRNIEIAVDECKADARRIMTDLFPCELDEWGLVAGIEAIQSHLQSTQLLEIEILVESADFEEFPRFDMSIERIIHRATEELLINIGKHAYPVDGNTHRAWVKYYVQRDPGDSQSCVLEICVRDEGRGILPARVGEMRGTGLVRFKDQLEAKGFSLSVAQQNGSGATMMIRGTSPLKLMARTTEVTFEPKSN